MTGLTKAQKIIVRELQSDSRTTLETLSPMVGMSVSGLSKAIKVLDASEIITGYKAVIDRKKVGLDMLAILMIGMTAKALKDLDRFAGELSAMENVIEFARVAGDFDFYVKLATRNTDHHYEVARQIADLDGVARTMTFIVLKEHATKDLPIG